MSIDVRFDRYYPYQELTERLQALVSLYPELLQLDSIGKSYQGRDVWCVTATNVTSGPASTNQPSGATATFTPLRYPPPRLASNLVHKLATEYGHAEEVTRALDTRAFYIVPRVNPDGAELYFAARRERVKIPILLLALVLIVLALIVLG